MSQAANALDEEIARHRPRLRELAGMSLGRRWPQIDPSDEVNETIVQALKKQEQFSGPDLLAWLRGILRHRLLDRIRKEKQKTREKRTLDDLNRSSCWIESVLADPQPSPSGHAILQEEMRRLAEALAQLPEVEREVVTLVHYFDWTQAEVEEHLRPTRPDVTRPAVAGLYHRALKKLRKLLDNLE